MTANKDFKRLVRARMRKTGESYTTARLRLSSPRPQPVGSPKSNPLPPVVADYAKLAGMSDAAIKKATGCNWERWVWALDRVEAHTWPHRKIADYVRTKYKVQDWWTQAVTVGYERIKGLRAIGQRRGGGFEATKSKVFAVPVAKLFRSFLRSLEHKARSKSTNKRISIAWPDGSVVVANFASKGAVKSQVAVQHAKLADRQTALQMKTFWAERLDSLNAML